MKRYRNTFLNTDFIKEEASPEASAEEELSVDMDEDFDVSEDTMEKEEVTSVSEEE